MQIAAQKRERTIKMAGPRRWTPHLAINGAALRDDKSRLAYLFTGSTNQIQIDRTISNT